MNVGNVVTSFLGMFTTLAQNDAEATADQEAFAINKARIMRSMREQERAAQVEQQKGATEVGLLRTRGTQFEGAQKAAFAANNVDATSGTAADVMASTGILSELDASNARNNALAAALGHRMTARGYGEQAQQLERDLEGRKRQRMARYVGSWLNAGSSVLNLAASAGGGM